jgi:hypothetical protein
MKKFLQISMLSGLLALPSLAALATNTANTTATTTATTTTAPAAPAMSMTEVLSKLDAAGYNVIKEVELGRNGTYKVEAMNSKGQKVEFVVDPAKPMIEKQAQATKMLTASEVAKKVMDAGYTNITKIKFEGSRYDVKAMDKQGKSVKMDVNAVTGEITKDWF